MLPDKSWRSDAILRLFLSAVVCFFAGSFLVAGFQQVTTPSAASVRVSVLVVASLCCLGASLVLLRKVWGREDSLLRLALVLACFYAGMMLGVWAAKLAGTAQPSVGQMIISALSLQGAVLVLVAPFLREHGLTWTEAFGLKERWVVAILLGVLAGCIFLPIGAVLQNFSAELMVRLHLKPEQQQIVHTLQTDHRTAARAVFGVISVVLVPPAEESFFRGILYPWIKGAGFPRLALWGTSLLFAATHTNLISFLPLAAFAVALTLLYERTGNLLAPITAHAVFNAANMVSLYLSEVAPK